MAGLAALWSGLSLALRSPCSWMALVAALDSALLLRLAGLPHGRMRALISLGGTVLSIALGLYAVASTRIGALLGSPPHEALQLTGVELALSWWRLNFSPWDGLWALLALPLAWRLGR